MVFWKFRKAIANCFLQKKSNRSQEHNAPPALIGLALILLKFETITYAFSFYAAVLFHFFYFHTLNLLKIFKLETKFLFTCHIGRSPVMCSLFRPANSVDSIRRFPVKGYLSRSLNLIFKYLGFDCQVKLNFFPWLLFWALIQFEFTYIKWNNRQMGFVKARSENIVRSNNHR